MKKAIPKIITSYPLFFKELVIDYYLKTKNIEKTVDIFKISERSLFYWVKNKDKLENKKRIIKSKYTREVKKYIIKYVKRNINFDCNKLIRLINIKYNINPSRSTIYRILKTNKITYKKINIKPIYSNKNKEINEILELKKIFKIINFYSIVSIDETSVDTHINSLKGWVKKGKKINYQKCVCRKRFTLITAISNKKIIYYEIIEGSVNGDVYLNFIKQLIKKVNNKPLFFDNARIHHSLKLKKFIKENKINVIYNVPYHPEFNPIERVFSKLKFLIRRKNNNINKVCLIKNIKQAFKKITEENLNNFYEKSFSFLKKYKA